MGLSMTTNLDLIRATYEGLPQENAKNLLALLTPDTRWTEAAGFPYAGIYVGAEQIMSGVFRRLATEWDNYQAQVHTYLADGERVAAFGVYSGSYRLTGKSMVASFAHLYQLEGGKIVSMEQFVDSHAVRQALQSD